MNNNEYINNLELCPMERNLIFNEMNRVLSWLHSIDFQSLNLNNYGKLNFSYYERQVIVNYNSTI